MAPKRGSIISTLVKEGVKEEEVEEALLVLVLVLVV